MTVSTLTNKVTYIGNGSATSFAVPFKVLDVDHLVVKRRLISTNEIVYTYIGTDYSYSGIGDDAGTLTLDGAALSSLYQLEIERIVPYTQDLDIVNSGGFYPETVEEQLDLMTMGIQQIDAQSDDIFTRALMVPVGETAPSYDDFAAGFKGDPGGNVMAIGPFTTASTLTIPLGTTRVKTSSYDPSWPEGSAEYYEDDDVDVGANPRWAFESANGRKFRIDPYQKLFIEMFGGRGNHSGPSPSGVDNHPILFDAFKCSTYYSDFPLIAVGPEINFLGADYYYGQTIDLKKIVKLSGIGSGHNNFNVGTRFHFPVDTCGIIINTGFTSMDQKLGSHTGTAEGSVIKGIHLIPASGGTDTNAHGVWLRGRGTLIDVQVGEALIDDLISGTENGPFSFPGNGIQIVGNAGGSGALYGNANGWQIHHCFVEYVDGHGLLVSGTDVNTGQCLGFETRHCGGSGVIDVSGLGNTYRGLNLAGYANHSPLKGRVSHGGRQYQLISAIAGEGGATTPGTNEQIWYDMGAATTWPAWVSLATYTPDIPILVTGSSNRSVIIGSYTEGGTSHIQPPAIAIGGQTGYTRFSGVIHSPLIGTHNGLFTSAGIGGYTPFNTGTPGYTKMGDYSFTVMNGPSRDGISGGTSIFEHRVRAHGLVSWFWDWTTTGDQIYGVINLKVVWRVTGATTTTTFGRSAAVPYVIGFPQLAIIDPNDVAAGRIMNICTVLPSSGLVAKGERYWMNNAGASGFAENYCTTGGTIGSTAVFKTCNPISA